MIQIYIYTHINIDRGMDDTAMDDIDTYISIEIDMDIDYIYIQI